VNDDPKFDATPATAAPPPDGTPKSAAADADAIPMPKFSLWRRMQIPIIAAAVYGVIRVIGPTLDVEIVGIQNAAQIRNNSEAGIGVFWHRCIFPAAWIWRNRGVVVMNTVNFDGQWTRKVIEWLGFGTAQGSSSRGGMAGLTALAARLGEGKHVAFTVDGPRGPRYVAKPGPVILARRMNCPISVFHIGIESGYTFKKSWDLFKIPMPFSKAVMICAPVIRMKPDGVGEDLKATLAEMQSALERVRDEAEAWFSMSEDEKSDLRDVYAGRAPGASREKHRHH
jgi:lysophospholipid acyltransferase (LPLAT)-like uncharacterized protein